MTNSSKNIKKPKSQHVGNRTGGKVKEGGTEER